MTLEDWTRFMSLSNNVTDAVLQLEDIAQLTTNHAQNISSYVTNCLHVFYSSFLIHFHSGFGLPLVMVR